MFKSILAAIAAAACAGVIVGFVPDPVPAVAAGAPQSAQPRASSTSDADQPAVVAVVRVADTHKAACTQAWPYYEQPCLHDGRQPNGNARLVRVVTADRPAGRRALPARH